MSRKKWIIYPQKSDNIIKQLLINRRVPKKGWANFLESKYENLLDPKNLNDISVAIKRIIKAIKVKETIGIFADYDADGVSGAAILANFFDYLEVKSIVYIPTREEGYGLNEGGVKGLRKEGCKLIITVDLGITGKEQIKLAKKMGIDVIVTDHHLFEKNQLPKDALALVHPRLSEKYSNKDLTGGGVVFKLIQAISGELKKPNQNQLKWFLDLAAISTVCDVVSLIGENRVITKFGMTVLARTKNIGLEELMKVAKIDPKKISTYTLGFQIGPRINAPGRMFRRSDNTVGSTESRPHASGDHAQISYYLLTTRNRQEAKKLAEKLDKINRQRQDALEKAVIEAQVKIQKRGLLKNKIILLEDKGWSEGIIGLIAGKLTEKFYRPAIVFHQGEKELKGSARSISEFHILEALDGAKKFIIKYGGHAGAAGLQVAKSQYPKFAKKLIEIANSELSDNKLEPKIKIDAEIVTPKINLALFNEIKRLEPFGMGNPRPVFLTRQLEIVEKRLLGKESNHLKLLLKPLTQNLNFDAIGFNCEDCHKDLKIDDVIDIVYYLDENVWNNNRKIQLKILDIQKSK